MEPLQKIEMELQAKHVEVEASEPTPNIPFAHLLLTLPSDTSEVDSFTVILSIIGSGLLAANFESAGDSDLIQILCPFSYEVQPDKVGEVSHLIHLLNKSIVLGAFGYDEYEKRCFFRYAMPLNRSQPDFIGAADVVLLVQEILNIYAPAIEDVALGVSSIEEFRARFQQNATESESAENSD